MTIDTISTVPEIIASVYLALVGGYLCAVRLYLIRRNTEARS